MTEYLPSVRHVSRRAWIALAVGVLAVVVAAGSLYIADGNNRVLMLASGSSTPSVLPVTGLVSRWTPRTTSTSPTSTTLGC